MKRYDAIVVGAGPAGSTAAYRLASAGADVLLLDRARFPRDKPCGGGVTGRAARLLPFSIEPVVEHVVSAVDLRLHYGKSLARGSGDPLVYMTQRKRLDHFLVQKAVEAGADFREGVKVSALEMRDGGVSVEGVEADVLIGADGVNGITARTLGIGGNRVVGVALEGNMPYAKMNRSAYDGRLALELGVVPGGYGWVFPKGDHANFGVGGWEEEGPRLRDHLRRLCDAHGASFDDLEELRGYRLPLREPGSTMARGRALLVGDAAGLIDPVSGDGMFEGFLSSQYASEAALDLLEGRAESLDPYGARLAKRLANHLWASWGVKVALDRYPRATFGLASTKLVWGAVERLVRGEVAASARRKLAATGCGDTQSGGSPTATSSETSTLSAPAPMQIVALTKQGEVVVIDRETKESRVVASFPPREDPQVEAGSFRAVDVTALPGGRLLVATCCEPAAGHMYALSEDGHRLKDQDLFAEDAGHDAGARVASGELVGLVIRPLSDLSSAAYTLALPPDLTGFSPDNISWAPGEDRIAFTIGGKLAVVDVSADSLADATFVDPSDGSHWSGAAYTIEGTVAVEQGGDPLHPSGPSRLLRVDMESGTSSEVVSTKGRVTDLAVDSTGTHLLWVEGGNLRWSVDDEGARLPGDFIAASWMSAA